MSWQDDAMIEQEQADARAYTGEAEWKELYKTKGGNFADRFGGLTVEQALELNEKARQTCEFEITTLTEVQ